MDADTDGQGFHDLTRKIIIDRSDSRLHLQGRGNGVIRVATIGNGRPEQCQEPIPQILIHDPPVLEDDSPHDAEEMVEHGYRLMRTQLPCKERETAEVNIHQGQGL
ncbi:MAG TPA: hypothetical protein DCZ97_06675 [Syntrophus sp. (in: bacteria)]|nr:hypothetical protein [Syntrophus sp. (in: bacteria)]